MKNPKDRPSAFTLLNSELFMDKDQVTNFIIFIFLIKLN